MVVNFSLLIFHFSLKECLFRKRVLQVPEVNIGIVGSRDKIAPVGRETHGGSAQLMRLEAFQDVAGLRLQQVYRAVGLPADAGKAFAIAVEV